MNNKKIIIISLIVVFILSITLSIILTKKIIRNKYEQPEIESLEVFGQKVEIESKKKVYEIFMDSAELKSGENNSCQEPINIKFKNGYELGESSFGISDEKTEVFFHMNATKNKVAVAAGPMDTLDDKQTNKKITHIEDYDVFIHVSLDSPLELDEICSNYYFD